MTSPIRRCSQKGKAVATDSESESTGSPLIRRPRAITLGRPRTANICRSGVSGLRRTRYSQQLTKIQAEGAIDGDVDSVVKEKTSAEKEVDFALADFLPMKWNGTDFEFDKEIDPDQERTLSTKKKQNWANHLATKPTFKSVIRLIFQTNPPAGFSFLIPADHQRPWTPPSGYACVYESWFVNSSLWWPLPEFLTTYCNRRKIALGQYTANGIRILVTLTVLAAELGIKMPVRLFEELTTPNRISKWSQGGSESFLEEVEAIRTLNHQHWPYISEAPEIPTEASIHLRKRPMGKLNLSALPSYADTIGTPEHGRGSTDVGRPSKRKRDSSSSHAEPSFVTPLRSPLPPPEVPEERHGDDQGEQRPSAGMPAESADMAVTEMPMTEHPTHPPPEDAVQGSQLEGRVQVTHGEEVEYPHVIDFKYRSIDVPFIEDHEAPARLFRQIKLKKRGMQELDQLHQDSRYREMTRAGAMIEALTAEKNEASSEAELVRSRNELLSAEIEALKAQKDLLDSRCLSLEQEKSELSASFEATTKHLRKSREHEVRKERLRVESVLRQQVIPTYEKMGQFLGEQPEIQSRLALYSQAKGTREGLEKIQSQGLAMDEVLRKAKIEEAHFLEELQKMEVVDADEIDLHPISLDEHGSKMMAFSPQDLEELRS
ncbi:hypothetical protein N665_0554s0009 [Sinapis alba]|nr:hypothetical protein N665_0554s0009 [Sinapis alba]